MYFVELYKKGAIGMDKRKAVRRVRNRRGWAVRFLLIALAVFLFLKAVQLYGQIIEKRQAEAELDNKIRTQMVVNEGLQDQGENAEEHLENKANDNGYFHSGQQIYQAG